MFSIYSYASYNVPHGDDIMHAQTLLAGATILAIAALWQSYSFLWVSSPGPTENWNIPLRELALFLNSATTANFPVLLNV